MRPQILVVDSNEKDAEQVIVNLQSILQHTVDIHHVISLKDACAFIISHTVDVIILDLNLSDSSGLETLQALRRLISDKPMIVLTNEDGASLTAQVLITGGFAISKHAERGQLGITVADAIESYQRRAETRDELLYRIDAMSRLLSQVATEFEVLKRAVSDLKQDNYGLHAAEDKNTRFRIRRQTLEVFIAAFSLIGSLFTVCSLLYFAWGK